jgi:hypothetical protein
VCGCGFGSRRRADGGCATAMRAATSLVVAGRGPKRQTRVWKSWLALLAVASALFFDVCAERAERAGRGAGGSSPGGTARRGGQWFVAAPAWMETGGPEALHQLCMQLRGAGEAASMLYLGPMHKLDALNAALKRYHTVAAEAPGAAGPSASAEVARSLLEAVVWGAETPQRYAYTGCGAASRLPLDANDVLVLPEVWTQYLDVIGPVRKVVWWLSVDNNGGSFQAFAESAARGVLHVSNSHYGVDYLKRRGISHAFLLPDYIHSECGGAGMVEEARGVPASGGRGAPRHKLIVYNPSKGADETTRILAALSMRAEARRAAARAGAARNESGGRVLAVPVQHMSSSAPLLSRARVRAVCHEAAAPEWRHRMSACAPLLPALVLTYHA